MVIPPESYSEGVLEAVEAIKAKGYTVKSVRNAWDGGGSYKGLNVTFEDAAGNQFEVQFHTPESFHTNKLTHDLYEERRRPGTSPERAAELEQRSQAIVEGITTPRGAAGLNPS